MSVITIFSGIFCSADAVVRDVMDSTGYRLITDDRVVRMAGKTSGMPEDKVRRAFSAKTSVLTNSPMKKSAPSPASGWPWPPNWKKALLWSTDSPACWSPGPSAMCSGCVSSQKYLTALNRPGSSRGWLKRRP
jgi:hypothetical protein